MPALLSEWPGLDSYPYMPTGTQGKHMLTILPCTALHTLRTENMANCSDYINKIHCFDDSKLHFILQNLLSVCIISTLDALPRMSPSEGLKNGPAGSQPDVTGKSREKLQQL